MKLILCFALISITSVSSNKITCSFKGASFGKYKINYKCIAIEFEVRLPNEEFTGILGVHLEGKTNNDIGILIIKDKKVHYLPDEMQQYLPNLYHLDLDNTGLKEINQNKMKMFPKLKFLYIRNNDLSVLPAKVFDENKHLQFINLNDNKIKYIAPNVFDFLSELVSLSIEENVCINNSAIGNDEITKLKIEIEMECSLYY